MNTNATVVNTFVSPRSALKVTICALAVIGALSLSGCGKKAQQPTTAERLQLITQKDASTASAAANVNPPKTAAAGQPLVAPVAK